MLPELAAGAALLALLALTSVPAARQLHRAIRTGDRARVGLHGSQVAGACVAAALVIWWRR